MAVLLEQIVFPFHSLCEYLAGLTEMKIDQIRYFLLWIVSMPLGFLMYYGLHPSKTSATLRHIYATTLGVIMGLLCFGREMFVVFAAITISYAILLLVPPRLVQKVMMVYIVVITACAHMYRMVYDYGGYTLDFTGPLMVLVQKFSLTAFALHDGLARKYEDLSEDQRRTMIDCVPSVLSYFSYCFNFLQFLSGPSCTIKEYEKFIDGTNFHVDNPNKYGKAKLHVNGPSTILPWFWSLLGGLVAMVLYLTLQNHITLESYIRDDRSYLVRPFYCWSAAFVYRCRYYLAWKLSESIGNASGLGFSGYDEKGNPQWETCKNCKPIGFELGTNMRGAIGSWNITTNTWLRRVCYTQAPFCPTMLTFLLSALWHGFYPGYYLCLMTMAILVEAARKGRSIFRPYFIGNTTLKFIYDIITFFFTGIFLNLNVISFIYLDFKDALKCYTDYYCLPTIIPIVFLLLPLKTKRRPKSEDNKTEKNAEKQPDVKTSYREQESQNDQIKGMSLLEARSSDESNSTSVKHRIKHKEN